MSSCVILFIDAVPHAMHAQLGEVPQAGKKQRGNQKANHVGDSRLCLHFVQHCHCRENEHENSQHCCNGKAGKVVEGEIEGLLPACFGALSFMPMSVQSDTHGHCTASGKEEEYEHAWPGEAPGWVGCDAQESEWEAHHNEMTKCTSHPQPTCLHQTATLLLGFHTAG